MGLSKDSLISPEEPKPGIPLKKSTLAVIVVAVLVLGVVSSMMFSGAPSQPTDLTAQVKEAPASQVLGRPQSIDEEMKAAQETPSPVPASVRRPDSTASLYEKPLSKLEGESVTPVVAPRRESSVDEEGALRAAEREAEVRLSKSVVVDFDGGPGSTLGAVAGALGTTPAGSALGAANSVFGSLPPTGTNSAPSAGIAPTLNAALDQLRGAAAQKVSRTSWVKEYAGDVEDKRQGGKTLRSYQSPSNLVLHQGKVIPAVLGRAINSDLPGRLTAYTTLDIYDSLGKGQLLIPKGSVLDGQYDSDVKVGQARILFAFERLILPDGTSFDLPPAPGSDLRGAAGLDGDVNNHFFKMFASSFFIAVLADQTTTPTGTNIGSQGAIKGAAGEVLVDVSKTILDRNKVIPPTITVKQGVRINVEVVSDMVFPRAYSRR
ncbi:MAG: conjugal transfer protein TrbI [Hydrogenophaga sp.]|uniref:TrbI/VirB10 family protein n=1 Tax=Hydrogenophaga sp. TaxID=1904254 RepID=UPI00260C5A2B|nr:TrbI/VirB10 family protein [Hydrogenophaga sp.]MCV0438997.1 conjugal transfer protein TrbI [Hydrogenophaga sp.]